MQAMFFILLAAVCLVDVPALLKTKSKPEIITYSIITVFLIVTGILFLNSSVKLSIAQFLMQLIYGGEKI